MNREKREPMGGVAEAEALALVPNHSVMGTTEESVSWGSFVVEGSK